MYLDHGNVVEWFLYEILTYVHESLWHVGYKISVLRPDCLMVYQILFFKQLLEIKRSLFCGIYKLYAVSRDLLYSACKYWIVGASKYQGIYVGPVECAEIFLCSRSATSVSAQPSSTIGTKSEHGFAYTSILLTILCISIS